jgi:hypothetical protein
VIVVETRIVMVFISRFLILASIVVLSASTMAHANGKRFGDRDWSTGFYDNCGFPASRGAERPVEWVKIEGDRKLRFVLREGQKGKCPTDDQVRHRAPYWERAEVRQDGYLELGSTYRISFEAIFLEGFTGEREAFFQVHGHNGSCDASPPVMVKLGNAGLVVDALQRVSGNGLGAGKGKHRPVQSASVRPRALYGQRSKFVVDFDSRSNPARLSMTLNGQRIVNNAAVSYAPCARPYIKFGIYRPGGKGSATSSVVFDDILIEELR